jgi:hypothetical protein
VATAVVATELVLTEASAETLGQTDELEVAGQQLQLAAGSKLFTTQFDRKIPLDHPPYLQAHLWGPPVSRGVVDYALYTTHERPFFFQSVYLYRQEFLLRGSSQSEAALEPRIV